LRLRTKRHPPGVEHTLHGSASSSKPASTVEVGDRSAGEASVDRLTGVFNCVCFEAQLSEEFERARLFSNDFVLVFFDIDEFKPLNEARGRRAEDDAFVLVAPDPAVQGAPSCRRGGPLRD
jgi:PleD family two-component response regulator